MSLMEELDDYVHGRMKSSLTRVELTEASLPYAFTGDAASAESRLIDTNLPLFMGDDHGTSPTVFGFSGGGIVRPPHLFLESSSTDTPDR